MTGIILTTQHKELFKEKYFTDYFVHKINGRKFYVVKSLTDEMFIISFCSNNEYDVASCATHMITNFNLTSMIHVGCGILNNNSISDFDLLLVNDVIDFNNKIEYIDGSFETNKNKIKFETSIEFNELIRKILSTANLNYSFGQSTIVHNKNILELTTKNIPIIYDFESVPIARICEYYKIMYSILKIKIDSQYNINSSISLIEQLIYNIIQEISYFNLKLKNEKNIL